AGNAELEVAQCLPLERLARDDDRAVAGAHARAVREQHVMVLHEGICVQREGSYFEPSLERPLVERLDVAQDVLELEAAGVDRAFGQGPEHERVVRIGTVAEADQQGEEATRSALGVTEEPALELRQ